jgi:hypothetical protein
MKKYLLLIATVALSFLVSCTFPDIPGLSRLNQAGNNSWFYGPISILMWIFLLAIYFMPTIIAVVTRKSRMVTVFLINAFLGWTVVGWIIALILARI